MELEEIFQSVVDSYRSNGSVFLLISQISDLAKAEYLATFESAKHHPDYVKRMPIEAPIYARYLLMELSLRFAQCE